MFHKIANTVWGKKTGAHILIILLVMAPILLLAYGNGAPSGYTGAPLASSVDFGTCTACHRALFNPAGGSVTVSGFASGNTYTPGSAARPLTVTVNDSARTSGFGFQLTSRVVTSSLAPAGVFAAGSNSEVICTDDNPMPAGGCTVTPPVEFIGQTSSSSRTFSFNWTPPATNVGNIVFYVAGVAGGQSGAVYTNSYTLTPMVPPALPTLSAAPPSLSFSYQSGSSTLPASQNFTVSSSNSAQVPFNVAKSGGSWLSTNSTVGTTSTASATISVSVDTSGLAVGTYQGSVTISSSGASNTVTVGVNLQVTAPPAGPSLSVLPTKLSFSPRNSDPKTVEVSASEPGLPFTVSTSVTKPAGGTWLSATASAVTTSSTTVPVTVSIDTTGLPGGRYIGYVVFTLTGVPGSSVTVPVSVRVPKH